MSKSDQNAAKNQANQQTTQNNTNETAANGQLQSILGTASSTAASVLPSVVSGYSDIASSGGYDPSVLGTANATFGNLANNGGISGADATAIEDKAASAARSTYSTGADAAQRAQAATGGYGVSGSIGASLARKGSDAAAAAVTGADASIAGLKQSGEVAGATGLVNTQQNIASNKLQATSGLTNVYGLNENQVNSTVGQILQNYQQTGQLNNQDLSILTNLANQPGVFDKIVGTIGTLGGAAAGIISGVKP